MVRRDGAKADWLCRRCERGPQNLPLSNSGTRTVCRGCNLAKGTCYLRDDDTGDKSKGGVGKGKGSGKSFAERQVQQQRKQQPQQQQQNKELAALGKKVTALEAAAKGEGKPGSACAAGVADGTEDCSAVDEAAKARSKRIEGLQTAVSALEALPGESTSELDTLRRQLAELRQARDCAKPVTNRVLNATRLVDRRVAAAIKAAAARELALEAFAVARRAVEATTAALAAAHTATAEAQQELHQLGTLLAAKPAQDEGSVPSDVQWDTITAVLTQLQQLPSAMAAGNGNAAWLSIQENGLHELQKEAEKRAEAKLQQKHAEAKQAAGASDKALVKELFSSSATQQRRKVPKFDGFTGLPVPLPDARK